MSGTSEQFYRGEAGQRYQQQKRAVPQEAIPWVARLRAEKLQSHICATDVVVEFGAGLGWNLINLRCARRIGTDLEDYLPPNLKQSDLEFCSDPAAISNETADVVICHHVLEHVENPREMLHEARRILKGAGKILVFVPYEKEIRYRHYDPNEPNHHLFSWNAQTLGNLVAAQQFNVESCKIGEFGYDRFASKLSLRFRLGENGFRAIRRFAHLLRPGREVQLVAAKASVSEKA